MSSDLKHFALLAEFTEEDREAFAELLEPKTVMGGRSIFRQNAEGDGLVLIVSGRVEVSASRTSASEIFGPGEVLGALSLVAMGPREATAIADGPCEVLLLPRTSFRRLVDDHPRTACRLIEAVMAELVAIVRPSLDAIAARPPEVG